jgi:hypothetical protein
MKIDFDTEFIDDGKKIEFISIGMVREDGKQYYAVTDNVSVIYRAIENDWLRKNVVNSLPLNIFGSSVGQFSGRINYEWDWDKNHKDFGAIKPKEQIAQDIRVFCTEHGTPELWAWYAAYDHVVLSQIFGKMLDLPEDIPMWTNDLRQELHRLGNPRYPEQQEGAHNALEDAKWNRTLRKYLESLDGPLQGRTRVPTRGW